MAGDMNLAAGTPVSRIVRWDGVHFDDMADGALYVAGEFSHAGEVPARNIARWDGVHWSALEKGLDDKAKALAVLNDVVYVGGWFKYAGEKPSTYIAAWGESPAAQRLFMPIVLR